MRVLLYGMQSSGASLLAFTLAQRPDSVAFVDIWNMFAAPVLETDRDCVAKVVVTTAYSLAVHRRRFLPDVTLFVLRHPTDTYNSLIGKPYAIESGLIDEKFTVWEEVFRAGKEFDHLVHYEDFVFSPRSFIDFSNSIGWPIGEDALLFNRTQAQIEDQNVTACPDIHSRLRYSWGAIRSGGLQRDRVKFAKPSGASARLPGLCPALLEHYATVRAQRGELWPIPSSASHPPPHE